MYSSYQQLVPLERGAAYWVQEPSLFVINNMHKSQRCLDLEWHVETIRERILNIRSQYGNFYITQKVLGEVPHGRTFTSNSHSSGRLKYFQDTTSSQHENWESCTSFLCWGLQRLHMNLETIPWCIELQTFTGKKTGTYYCCRPRLAAFSKQRVCGFALLRILVTWVLYLEKSKCPRWFFRSAICGQRNCLYT